MSNSITVTREQITKLHDIVDHFSELTEFTIKIDDESGVPGKVIVSFALLEQVRQGTGIVVKFNQLQQDWII